MSVDKFKAGRLTVKIANPVPTFEWERKHSVHLPSGRELTGEMARMYKTDVAEAKEQAERVQKAAKQRQAIVAKAATPNETQELARLSDEEREARDIATKNRHRAFANRGDSEIEDDAYTRAAKATKRANTAANDRGAILAGISQRPEVAEALKKAGAVGYENPKERHARSNAARAYRGQTVQAREKLEEGRHDLRVMRDTAMQEGADDAMAQLESKVGSMLAAAEHAGWQKGAQATAQALGGESDVQFLQPGGVVDADQASFNLRRKKGDKPERA